MPNGIDVPVNLYNSVDLFRFVSCPSVASGLKLYQLSFNCCVGLKKNLLMPANMKGV